MRTFILIMVLIFSGICNMARAADSPLVYSRSLITIIVSGKEPSGKDNQKTEKQTRAARAFQFDVDIRPEGTIRSGWFLNSGIEQNGRALMAVQESTGDFSLLGVQAKEAMDVLLVNDEGQIITIVPEIILINQQSEIPQQQPAKAAIFLAKGMAAKLGIAPGDIVKHEIFIPKPQILNIEEKL